MTPHSSLHPHPHLFSNNLRGESNSVCTSDHTSRNKKNTPSEAIFIQPQASEVASPSTEGRRIPQVGRFSGECKTGPDVSQPGTIESINATVCAEVRNVSLILTLTKNRTESLIKQSSPELCDGHSQEQCESANVHTDQQNPNGSQLSINTLYKCDFQQNYIAPEEQTFAGGRNSLLDEKQQPITVKGFSLGTQSPDMPHGAHDHRVAYILGADHDSLLRAITADATRTFIHTSANFVCFYIDEVEKETMSRHEAKKDSQHFRTRHRQSITTSDSRSNTFLSDEDMLISSPNIRVTREIDCQSTKYVQPTLSDPVIPSDIYSCHSTSSEYRFNWSLQANSKSKSVDTKGLQYPLLNSVSLRTNLHWQHLERQNKVERDAGDQRQKERCYFHWMPLAVSMPGQNYLIHPSCVGNIKVNPHRHPLGCQTACPFQKIVERGWMEAQRESETAREAVTCTPQPQHISQKLKLKKVADKEHWYSFCSDKPLKFFQRKDSHSKIENKLFPSWLIESMFVELGPNDVEASELALNALRSRLSLHLPPFLETSESSFDASFSSKSDQETTNQSTSQISRSRMRSCLNEDTKSTEYSSEWTRPGSRKWTARKGQLPGRILSNSSRHTRNTKTLAKRRRQRLAEGLHNLQLNNLVHSSRDRKIEAEEDVPVAVATLLFLPFPETFGPQKTNLSECDNPLEKVFSSEREGHEADQFMASNNSEVRTKPPTSCTCEGNQAFQDAEHQSQPNTDVTHDLPKFRSDSFTIIPSIHGDLKSSITVDCPSARETADAAMEAPQPVQSLNETEIDIKLVDDPHHSSLALSAAVGRLSGSEMGRLQQRWDVVVLLYGATTSTVLEALLKAEQCGLGIAKNSNAGADIFKRKYENVCDNNKSTEDSFYSYASRPSKNAGLNGQGVGRCSKRVGDNSLNTARTFSLPSCTNTEVFSNGFANAHQSLDNGIPCGGSAYYEDSIVSILTPRSPSHQFVQQSTQQHQPMRNIARTSSHFEDMLNIHKDPWIDLSPRALDRGKEGMLNAVRNRRENKSNEGDNMSNNDAGDMVPHLSQQESASVSSLRTTTFVERNTCFRMNNNANALEDPAVSTQELPESMSSDVLAPVCDPIHFPQGLLLPVKLIYIRISDRLYRVAEVVDQSFIQYREKRVFQSAETTQSHQSRQNELTRSYEVSSNGLKDDKISRMRSAFNSLMGNIPTRSTSPVQDRSRSRRRPFALHTALRESVYSFSPNSPEGAQTECERVNVCWQCLSSEARVIFLPCGHFSTCEKCSNRAKECHVCQAKILSTIILTG